MKKIIALIAFVMVGVLAFAQNKKGPEIPYPDVPIDEQTNLVTYKEVVQQPNATPQELYDRAMNWVKSYYKNTAEVIKSSDRDKGVIQLRSSVRIYVVKEDGSKVFKNIVYYNMKIECRPGRYRYTITDFNEKASNGCSFNKCFTMEVFPAPEGADTMINFPDISLFLRRRGKPRLYNVLFS